MLKWSKNAYQPFPSCRPPYPHIVYIVCLVEGLFLPTFSTTAFQHHTPNQQKQKLKPKSCESMNAPRASAFVSAKMARASGLWDSGTLPITWNQCTCLEHVWNMDERALPVQPTVTSARSHKSKNQTRMGHDMWQTMTNSLQALVLPFLGLKRLSHKRMDDPSLYRLLHTKLATGKLCTTIGSLNA